MPIALVFLPRGGSRRHAPSGSISADDRGATTRQIFARSPTHESAICRRWEGCFCEVLKLAEKAGLAKLGHVALDGTKIKANAPKHKAMSYARMKT